MDDGIISVVMLKDYKDSNICFVNRYLSRAIHLIYYTRTVTSPHAVW
jgi:hypothetical protein